MGALTVDQSVHDESELVEHLSQKEEKQEDELEDEEDDGGIWRR